MKREAKLLLDKGVDSLVLSIEFFNRPWERGRVEAVLILLDHSFEMLLKAAILQKGGRIRERGKPNTIGFDRCVGLGQSEGKIRFLEEADTVVLHSVNTLRDAAQHHILDLSEQNLYIQAQAGITLFRRIMKSVFDRDLALELPDRVLPLSTTPPTDLATLFDTEVQEVRRLLQPGKRQRLEAMAKLRGLAIVNGAIAGTTALPSPADLYGLSKAVAGGKQWNDLFPGVATVSLTVTGGTGPQIGLRITKKDGIPVHIVRDEAASGTPVIAVKRVDELGFYNLGRDDLADKVGLNKMMTTAMIWHLQLQGDADYHKEIQIGSQRFQRYSPKAIIRIREAAATLDLADVWKKYKGRNLPQPIPQPPRAVGLEDARATA